MVDLSDSDLIGAAPNVSADATIAVFDAQRSYVDALRLALDITEDLRVVSSDTEHEAGIERLAKLEPSLLVTSNRPFEGVTGLDLIEELRSVPRTHGQVIPIVVLTAYPTPGLATAARMYSGVSVVSKHRPITDIVRSLRSVVRGKELFIGIQEDPYSLSRAELEVLELLVRGYSAAAIADLLHLSVHAIRARIRGVLVKTDSTSQLESVAKAIGAGVVAPPPLSPS